MKKLDKLILISFIGPLILTFCVSVFILLIQYMLKYFDDLVGKDLGYRVFAELILYFSINMTPIALPLAILIASIMAYGRLGEHLELTAIKGLGISLTRTLLPTGVLVSIISVCAFFYNDFIVPNANLRAYSLLYDIKHKKPSLDLREGQFYDGLNGYSIKIKKKYPDGIAMKDVIIYDHTGSFWAGNKKVIKADSCRMYTIADDRYLMLELYDGNHYIEGEKTRRKSTSEIETFTRTRFKKMKMALSLAAFDLERTDMKLFAGNRLMKNIDKLSHDIDSMQQYALANKYQAFKGISSSAGYRYHFNKKLDIPKHIEAAQETIRAKQRIADSLRMMEEYPASTEKQNTQETAAEEQESMRPVASSKGLIDTPEAKDPLYLTNDSTAAAIRQRMDSVNAPFQKKKSMLQEAAASALTIKNTISKKREAFIKYSKQANEHEVELYKKYSQAIACFIMFLIGAPLGAIIKKGGLGMPVVVSIFFFIIFYVMTVISDKWAKVLAMDGAAAAWVADAALLPFGILFLTQARRDAKLFDADFYTVWWQNLQSWWRRRVELRVKGRWSRL